MGSSGDSSYKTLPQNEKKPVLTHTQSQVRKEASDELERILSNTEVPFIKRVVPATWIEIKLLVHLAAPAVVVYMINYLMSMLTQIFSGHLGNLEYAAASLGNNGVQTFAYGLMVLLIFPHFIYLFVKH